MAEEHESHHAHHDGRPPAEPTQTRPAHHPHHGAHGGSTAALATHATVHCLLGCAIGELAGLMIGVGLGLNPWATTALATVLGFLSGYTLGLRPLVRQGLDWAGAFRLIWLGETVSIAVMEIAMNLVDYHIGGMRAGAVLSGRFWVAYVLALPAGFLAAWPVNFWLLTRSIRPADH